MLKQQLALMLFTISINNNFINAILLYIHLLQVLAILRILFLGYITNGSSSLTITLLHYNCIIIVIVSWFTLILLLPSRLSW